MESEIPGKPVDGSEIRLSTHQLREGKVADIPLFTTGFSTTPGGWPWDF